MRQYDDFDKVQAATGERETLEPGGYICKIIDASVKDAEPGKNYDQLMKIAFDIAEGEHAGYYKRQFERKKQFDANAKWPGVYNQTIRKDKLQYFKGMTTAIEESNPGYKWNWDEKSLKGKLFGGLFGEEEYRGNDGTLRVNTKLAWIRSVASINDGNYKIPPIKRLQQSPLQSAYGSAIPGFLPIDSYAADMEAMEQQNGDTVPF
jgi:hypothetical protein